MPKLNLGCHFLEIKSDHFVLPEICITVKLECSADTSVGRSKNKVVWKAVYLSKFYTNCSGMLNGVLLSNEIQELFLHEAKMTQVERKESPQDD